MGRTAEVKRDAKIGQAEATRDAKIKVCDVAVVTSEVNPLNAGGFGRGDAAGRALRQRRSHRPGQARL